MPNAPSVTSQYKVCPIPFKFDTYMGCPFQCVYCFSKITVEFNRKICGSNKKLTHISVSAFEKWFDKAMNSAVNYKNSAHIAIKERIPLKIGGNCDPCPPIELKLGITKGVLKHLHKYDYPVQILTKNPKVLYEIAKEFKNSNWALSVSLISSDDDYLKKIEVNTPSASERLKYISKLVDLGYKVFVKIQPAIYPIIIDELDRLIPAIKESGAWGFNIEGLKSKPSDGFLDALGIRRYYSRIAGSVDCEIKYRFKKEYLEKAEALAKKYKLKFYCADNFTMKKYGCNSECCGTEVLRDYKIFALNEKTLQHGIDKCLNRSFEFEKCFINHSHGNSTKNDNKTFDMLHSKNKGLFY